MFKDLFFPVEWSPLFRNIITSFCTTSLYFLNHISLQMWEAALSLKNKVENRTTDFSGCKTTRRCLIPPLQEISFIFSLLWVIAERLIQTFCSGWQELNCQHLIRRLVWLTFFLPYFFFFIKHKKHQSKISQFPLGILVLFVSWILHKLASETLCLQNTSWFLWDRPEAVVFFPPPHLFPLWSVKRSWFYLATTRLHYLYHIFHWSWFSCLTCE